MPPSVALQSARVVGLMMGPCLASAHTRRASLPCVADSCRRGGAYVCVACGGQICPQHTHHDSQANCNYCPTHAAIVSAQRAGIVFVDPVIELPHFEPVAPVEADPHIEFWSEQIFPALEWASERHDLLGFVVRSARDRHRLDPPLAAFALGLASWAVDIPGPGLWFGPESEQELRARALLPREMTTLLREFSPDLS
jgi:hypothetical protein